MDRSLLEAFGRRVRVGIMGTDSVIGRTHLIAMRADGLCDLVAGAMSVDPEIALSSGRQELLTTDRIYTDWREMLEKESQRPDRIDAVVIATPPRLHFPVSQALALVRLRSANVRSATGGSSGACGDSRRRTP